MGQILLPTMPVGLTTTPATKGWSSTGTPYLIFTSAANQTTQYETVIPADYASAITYNCLYQMASATSGVVAISAQVRVAGAGENAETKAFETLQTSPDSTVDPVAGEQVLITLALSNVGTLSIGDGLTLRIGRASPSGTNATGDMKLVKSWLTYTSS